MIRSVPTRRLRRLLVGSPHADDDQRLSWSTRIRFEQEANQAAAEMLFQRDLFTTMAAEYGIGFAAIVELCDRIGASIHSGTRRYAETHRAPVCALVLDQNPVSKEAACLPAPRSGSLAWMGGTVRAAECLADVAP